MKHTIKRSIPRKLKVAPFTGAWIETIYSSLKNDGFKVAPFTGAWIETENIDRDRNHIKVAPFTGAWIETS